jgi:DNA mismatch repair protein MutL
MSDIIHLLPDAVANQIAAGEVIQRPASAVKELLENAIDSGADEIKLFIKNAGKTLIQVIDNGCGMSETDARMCFERHATSKIKSAHDLFQIKTLGFRGEAMASMAAIAQVEMKTKRVEDELGTHLQIEGSEVIDQQPIATNNGTSIAIKNLFYNIPARRKFLKSNTTELRHIIEEFQRVALVNPGIKFIFTNESRQLFLLSKSNLKQRIVSIFGNNYNSRLIPVEQDSQIAKVSGFLGKPEFAKKTRGEQYFFVNGRFIKHPYLNHAVDSAFRELIPSDAFPTYFIYFDINPEEIDINIHPTKTEINFQNNQVIYATLNSTIKQSLGKFSINNTFDFDSDPGLIFNNPKPDQPIIPPSVAVNPDFNPFEQKQTKSGQGSYRSSISGRSQANKDWEKLFDTKNIHFSKGDIEINNEQNNFQTNNTELEESSGQENFLFQLHNKYIISNVRSGLMVIDQQLAHERILFENYLLKLDNGKGAAQQQLFPETWQLNAADVEIVRELLPDLIALGFDLEDFGDHSYIINGKPADLNAASGTDLLENILENYKKNLRDISLDKRVNLARSMAKQVAIKGGNILKKDEMEAMVNNLFACKMPEVSPSGKPIVSIITREEIERKFERKN